MEKIIKHILLLVLPVIFILSGCADSINAPDKISPIIDLYKPAKGDTVVWGKRLISYYASDDSKLAYIELCVDGKAVAHLNMNPDGSNPEIYWEIDSSQVNKKVSLYLIAVDLAGNTSRSNENTDINISENTEPPAAPKNLVVKKLSDNAVNLSWEDSSSNESEFQIWRKEAQGTYTLIQTLPKNSVSTNDYDLKPSVIYYYKVIAKNKYGTASSNEASTSDAKDLPVYNLSAAAKGSSHVHLSWVDNVANELGFVIQRKSSNAYNFSEIARTLPNMTSFEDTTGLTAGGTYLYRVAAIYQSGFSEWTNEVTVTTLSQNVLPPGNLTAVLASNSRKVTLSWNNNTTHNGTRIERKTGQYGNYTEIGRVDYNNTTYTDTSVSESNTYYYRVRGLLYSGEFTSYSNEAMITLSVIPPAAPSNLTLTRISNTIFNLKWADNADDEEGYEIWRKDGDGESVDYQLIYKSGKNSTSANDQVPLDNITYYYKVRAYKGSTRSAFSNVINSTGGIGNLPRPSNLAANVTKSSVSLSWTYPSTPSNILGFEIEKKVSWGEYNRVTMVLPSVKQYTDTESLTPTLIYFYRVRAITSTEQSDWTEISVTIPSSTAPAKLYKARR
ncbi:MAG: fibronectin type III domain-containing protein [Bacillota bacterium]